MDWIRLGRAQGDLSGVKEKRNDLTYADLAVHNRPSDMWMALRGNVYNITPYLNFHPGGVDELMRAAGKDGTELFDEIHNWVNVESMLEKCLVGRLAITAKLASALNVKAPSVEKPSQDWYQNETQVVIVVYTELVSLQREFVTVDIEPSGVTIQVVLDKHSYFVEFKPSLPVKDTSKVSVTKGKVEVFLEKLDAGTQWQYLGSLLPSNNLYTNTKSLTPKYREWIVTKNTVVTHDTKFLRLRAPKGFSMKAPIGYHIHIIYNISGMKIGRSYTLMPPSMLDPYGDQEQEEGRAIHLMIKYYSGGALSPLVTSASVGDSIKISNYDGTFDVQRLNNITHLILFAAGTGFTSMSRLINYALIDMAQATFPVKLIFNNKTQGDILWQDELEKLAVRNKRFSVVHVLSQEPTSSTWVGFRGRVNSELVEDFVPIPSPKCRPFVCICGPWAYNDTVESITKQRGIKDEHLHVFAQNSP